jgi:hypothetical protein
MLIGNGKVYLFDIIKAKLEIKIASKWQKYYCTSFDYDGTVNDHDANMMHYNKLIHSN